jgi:transcriptional regulator with XRE-family HTH domain
MRELNHGSFCSARLNFASRQKESTIQSRFGRIATMVDYGSRLSGAMKEKGVGIADLARELGLTYQAVRKVVRGDSGAFNAKNHVTAARFLGVSPEWLATGCPPSNPGSSPVVLAADPGPGNTPPQNTTSTPPKSPTHPLDDPLTIASIIADKYEDEERRIHAFELINETRDWMRKIQEAKAADARLKAQVNATDK